MFEHVIEGCQCKGKVCTKCNHFLCFGWFHKNPNGRYGLKGYCKECSTLVSRAWREVNKEYDIQRKRAYDKVSLLIRDDNRRSLYRIPVTDWNTLYEKQNGLCAICHKELDKGKFTHLDHCHKTDRIRGLLCSRCNRGLGFFGDNVDNLQRAYQYLINEGLE